MRAEKGVFWRNQPLLFVREASRYSTVKGKTLLQNQKELVLTFLIKR